jgi:hypothetical protein
LPAAELERYCELIAALKTLVRHIVLARVREHFRTQNTPGDHHAR